MKHLSLYLFFSFFLLTQPLAQADNSSSQVKEMIAALGLRENKIPSREIPGWKPPSRIVVAADNKRLKWLQKAAPGVKLISAQSNGKAMTAVKNAQAVIGFCNQAVLDAGKDLHWIQAFSAGVEHCVSLDGVAERNLILTNSQRLSSPEIAEHTIALMLALTRGLDAFMKQQTKGRWNRKLLANDPAAFWELKGRTLLIVGLGGIGTQVAQRAHALGMKVVAIRNSRREGPDYVSYVGLADELLSLTKEADVIVNAAPLTAATTGLFDQEFFKTAKSSAYFINVGRGKSVVTEDLVAALKANELAGVGLDVTEPEPLPKDHELWNIPRVIITPHVASRSDRVRERLWLLVRENLRRYVAGEPMLSQVNIARGY